MFKVKTLNRISEIGTQMLTDRGYTISDTEECPDAILVRSAQMQSYEMNKELLCIARAGAGTNNIPLSRCADEGIVVFNTPGANAEAVKELALCSLFLASRDIISGIEWVQRIADQGKDIPGLVEKEKSKFVGPEIKGKALGIIGLGAIGARIANAAVALGMKVYGYDPYLTVDGAWRLSTDVHNAGSLDTILKHCDYITIHVPYMQDTHHLLCADTFSKMRDGVRIINLARGELVCDEDMLLALQSGKVAKYVTDFPNQTLVGVPNVIAMPHLGGTTPESEENCASMASRSIIEYLETGNIMNSVNYPNVSMDRVGVNRICLMHKNLPGVLQSILNTIGGNHINIANMASKPLGELAYTMIDVDSQINEETTREIAQMERVLRIRVI